MTKLMVYVIEASVTLALHVYAMDSSRLNSINCCYLTVTFSSSRSGVFCKRYINLNCVKITGVVLQYRTVWCNVNNTLKSELWTYHNLEFI